MSLYLDISQRNAVLSTMAQLIDGERNTILEVNKKDLEAYKGDDLAM
ncbi:MAG TPA: glutamate-5-semialdehyde dehydrogenase, partial [Arenibacter sp.]|nr:glutamate-5-semialdehyde dehydrogenase [Arenibacter sp.]